MPFQFDSQIAVALLTLFASVVSFSVGLFRERLSSGRSNMGVALSDLYVPLELIVKDLGSKDFSESVSAISETIRANYCSVPPPLLYSYRKLQKTDHLVRNSFDEFINILDSYYNWHKKQLGYPYENSRIIPTYTLVNRKAPIYFWRSVTVFWAILLALMLIGVLPTKVRDFFALIAIMAQPFLVPYIVKELIDLYGDKKTQ